jgi:multicomponent Na+:H+ antiporter subunit F
MIDVESIVLITTVLLLIVFAAGLFRALQGPTLEDRMLSVQLLGTGGVALLMLLAELLRLPALLDVALILALLAAVSAAALTRREVNHD